MGIPTKFYPLVKNIERSVFTGYGNDEANWFIGRFACQTLDDVWRMLILYTRIIGLPEYYNPTNLLVLLTIQTLDDRIRTLNEWTWSPGHLDIYTSNLNNIRWTDYTHELSSSVESAAEGTPIWLNLTIPQTPLTPAQERLGRRSTGRGNPERTESYNLSITYSDSYIEHKTHGIIYVRGFEQIKNKPHISCTTCNIDKDKDTGMNIPFIDSEYSQLVCPPVGFIHLPSYKSLVYVQRSIGSYKPSYNPSNLSLSSYPSHTDIPDGPYNSQVVHAIFHPNYLSFEENIKRKRLKFPLSRSLAFIKIKRRSEYAVMYNTAVVGLYKKDKFHLRTEYQFLNSIINEEFDNAFN